YGSPLIALVLLAASLTRYEAWLLVLFLALYPGAGLRGRRIVLLPAALFALGWSLHILPQDLLARSGLVVLYEASQGAVASDPLVRLGNIFIYTLATSPLVYALGLVQGWRIRGYLPSFLFLHLTLLGLLTASGAGVGSFRYFSLPAAILAILAATSRSRLLPLALVSSFILLPYYLPLFDGLGSLYGPMARAGEFVGAQGVEGSILSDSPIPLYYSALPPERLLGPWSLPEEPGDALLTLDDWGVEYVIASGTPSRLTDLFPGLAEGRPDGDFLLVNSSGGWEVGYGGRKAHIYRYRRFGRYKFLGNYISSSPVLADLDGDGENELVAAADRFYVWRGDGKPHEGFPVGAGGPIASTPTVVDTDGDGRKEIFVGSDDDLLYAWSYNGTPVGGFPKTTGGDVFSSPLLVDLDGDGRPEVVVGSDDGKVYAWHVNGTPLQGWPVATGGYVSSSPIAEDLDMDGRVEVVVGSWDGMLYAWHLDGTMAEGFPLKTGGPVWAQAAVADLDGGGRGEIIAASDRVYAWSRYGIPIPGFPVGTGSYTALSLRVVDLDGDSSPEIVVGSDALYVLNASGAVRDGWPLRTGSYFWAAPALADLDGDGGPEILAGDWSGKVYALRHDGAMVKGFPKPTGDKVFASPVAGQFGGFPTILAGTWDGYIYLWRGPWSGSYRWRDNTQAPDQAPWRGEINLSVERHWSGVAFVTADLPRGKAMLHYRGDDGYWHPSPMVLSESRYVGIIAPQRSPTRYYITVDGERQYRFPGEGSYTVG
ncbi:MAG: PQQ-like beta-propeller repeat protein, partial [Euryarchaeota archaeon]|nr:PQQ-like beta-propeller repeat protein [Euryarchaeota archaeon]